MHLIIKLHKKCIRIEYQNYLHMMLKMIDLYQNIKMRQKYFQSHIEINKYK